MDPALVPKKTKPASSVNPTRRLLNVMILMGLYDPHSCSLTQAIVEFEAGLFQDRLQ
jgi:hypothetical protein